MARRCAISGVLAEKHSFALAGLVRQWARTEARPR